jgi:hypothetical protein
MFVDPEVYDRGRLDELNGGLFCCKKKIVYLVLSEGADTLEKLIRGLLGGANGEKAAQYADILLADFVRHRVLDGFREAEASMRATHQQYEAALQWLEDAKRATEKAKLAHEVHAGDFGAKLDKLRDWAQSVALARAQSSLYWRCKCNPCGALRITTLRRTPGDSVQRHDAISCAIDFIREVSESEVIAGHLERPVPMSDFESSLKAVEAAEACANARLSEETDAAKKLHLAEQRCNEESKKAIAALSPLSEAGQWALFRLFHDSMKFS